MAQDGREAAQQRIEQLEQQLAQERLALEDFTYSVSHDLRASLRHVSAYLNIVREDLGVGVDAAILSHLKTAGDAATHMARLMDGLQELLRIGRAELQLSEVDLSRVFADLRHQFDANGNRPVQWQLAPDLPHVWGDMALIGQMLSHLLANAIQFTQPVPQPRIEVGWSRLDDGWCELRIRDNGVGFDPRLQDRLFRVFQRLHSQREFQGIGIGLALARRVVERHGGRIAAHGNLGAGCEISLTLPMAPAHA